MSALIEIKNLQIGYSHKPAHKVLVDSINAKVEVGETIALLGLNGCGKTTLLRCMMKELQPLSGSIAYHGKSISDYTSFDLAKILASVNTRYENPGQVSVEDLVGFGRYPFTGRLHQLQKKDVELIDKAISIIGIEDLRFRFIEELSDGERQKVMLACAFAQDTSILILDEPTSHLDVRNKVAMMNLIRKFANEEQKTILFSTHDLGLAKNVASRIWLIHDKTIIDEKTSYFMENKLWKPLLEGIDEELVNWL